MSKEHNTLYKDNIAAYSLGALDTKDARKLEAHMKGCDECQQELAEYQAVSDGLLTAMPPQTPHSNVKQQLIRQLSINEKKPSNPSPWHLPQFSPRQALAAFAVMLLIGINLLSLYQISDLRTQQVELAERMEIEQSAIALIAYPETEIISTSTNGNGSLLLNTETNTAILLITNLPELPADQTYQIWLIDELGNRVSGGLFISQNELEYDLVQIDQSYTIQDFIALGITIEPAGGSPSPTGTNVFKVNF